MDQLHNRAAQLVATILCMGLWALPAAAQEFQIPPQSVLDAMSSEQKIAMARELTIGAGDWPRSELNERVMHPEMGEWTPQRSGTFAGADSVHWAQGEAFLSKDEETSEGIVRLENFDSPNGPGLHVYLVAARAPTTPEEIAADFIDLGALKANRGDYNYVFRDSIDGYHSVVIYSQPFDVIFAVAPLRR